MRNFLILVSLTVVLGVTTNDGSHYSMSFATAKTNMYEIEADTRQETIYCECAYTEKVPDWSSCGVQNREGTGVTRYQRTEAEHVVPAAVLCGETNAWKHGDPSCGDDVGRDCASTIAPCSYAYTDIHNLWAAVGGLNADRSDIPFVEEIDGEAREYGDCDFEVRFSPDPGVEIADFARGIVGRTSLYMYEAYSARGLDIDFSTSQLDMFKEWNCLFPPETWECSRNQKIFELQGNYNHVTKSACDLIQSDIADEYCPATDKSVPSPGPSCPTVFISQIYESGNSKHVELFNYHPSASADISNLYIGTYTNNDRQAFINGDDPNSSVDLVGSINPYDVVVVSKSTAVNPDYLTPVQDVANSRIVAPLVFTGDDSLTLYYLSGSTKYFCDVISVTTDISGDKSFVRSPQQVETPITYQDDFTSTWKELASLDTVNNAGVGSSNRLGSHNLFAVPNTVRSSAVLNFRLALPANTGDLASTVTNDIANLFSIERDRVITEVTNTASGADYASVKLIILEAADISQGGSSETAASTYAAAINTAYTNLQSGSSSTFDLSGTLSFTDTGAAFTETTETVSLWTCDDGTFHTATSSCSDSSSSDDGTDPALIAAVVCVALGVIAVGVVGFKYREKLSRKCRSPRKDNEDPFINLGIEDLGANNHLWKQTNWEGGV